MNEVEVHVSDKVAVLRLSAPARRNALTPAMAQAVIDACDDIDRQTAIGAVVLCGAGGFFCAGADRAFLAQATENPSEDRTYRDMGVIYDSFLRVGALKPPTIAAIRGGAVGAGVNLAFATDLRVIGDDAILDAGFMRLGIHPGGGHFALLCRTAGREIAAGLGLFGGTLLGSHAAAIGAAWTAVPDDAVETSAMAIATPLARDPDLARATARSFRSEVGPPAVSWAVGLQSERAPQMWSLQRKKSTNVSRPDHEAMQSHREDVDRHDG